jgi:hypothetical protein
MALFLEVLPPEVRERMIALDAQFLGLLQAEAPKPQGAPPLPPGEAGERPGEGQGAT